MTGERVVRNLPYWYINRSIWWVKSRTPLFSKSWPEDDPSFTSGASVDVVEKCLKAQDHFEEVDLSYHYEGQEAELRRAEGIAADGTELEVHIRGRSTKRGGSQWVGHVEANRYSEKKKHAMETHVAVLDSEQVGELVSGGELDFSGFDPV